MSIGSLIFYVFLFLTVASCLTILFTRHVFKAALLLLTCLLSIAALYIFLSAEFVSVTQIMIYAGGIVVVIVFGIMLTSKISDKALHVHNKHVFGGLLTGLSLFIILYYASDRFTFASIITDQMNGKDK